jgi:Lrp/AsnC family transcriptional regulator, leucine-responsive regulatory protein
MATEDQKDALDRIDRRILDALQRNARISNLELADKVGLSASPCLRRVRQLEESGYIRGYATLLNASALGLKLLALVQISMDRHTPDRFEQFEATIKTHPQVLECILITGQAADYQLKVIVKDMEEYQDFLLNTITRIPGVTDVHSSFVLRQVIATTALPLDNL